MGSHALFDAAQMSTSHKMITILFEVVANRVAKYAHIIHRVGIL
jgi:hypothetical protein